MDRQNDVLAKYKVCITAALQDIIHCRLISHYSAPRRAIRISWVFPIDSGNCVFSRNIDSFNTV